MRLFIILSALLFATACTVTDEETQLLDETSPRFSISVNGQIAYSTISQNWGPITCNDGTSPSFIPSGSIPGIAIPLQENGLVPTYPVEITVLAMDPAGVQTIMMSGPNGIFVPDAPATVSPGTSQFSFVRTDFASPYGNTEGMTFRYSRDGASSTRFRITIYDAAGSVNETIFDVDMGPESDICS